MKQNNNTELIGKFWKGETNLTEEESLFAENQSDSFKDEDRAYFRFINNARKVEYTGETEIWQSIVSRNNRRKKIIYIYSGIAASILLLISISILTLTVSKDKNIETQIASNNIHEYYKAFKIEKSSNPTLYINGCKSSSDYHTALQAINPKCIQNINLTNESEVAGKLGGKKGKVEVWLKGKLDEVFSVCEGTLYFYQDGEIKSISIHDDCSPNLLVDCHEIPLSKIEELKPQQIKSIELTTDPRNCNGIMNGEFIVMESK